MICSVLKPLQSNRIHLIVVSSSNWFKKDSLFQAGDRTDPQRILPEYFAQAFCPPSHRLAVVLVMSVYLDPEALSLLVVQQYLSEQGYTTGKHNTSLLGKAGACLGTAT